MWGAVIDLLLPAVCPACRVAPGAALCCACAAGLEAVVDPCRWCGASRADAGRCPTCEDRGFAHCDTVTVPWVYTGTLLRLVALAKIEGRPAAVAACARLMPSVDMAPDAVVVPVPPSPGRRAGPHVATALARALARQHQRPLRRALRLVRLAAEQHRLSRADRARNVAGIFASRALHGPVVLVDDLVTSGATVSAAAAALRHAGATAVQVVALGRTCASAAMEPRPE